MASTSPLLTVLISQPEAALEQMKADNQREHEEIKATLARNEVEGGLIAEALAKKSKGAQRAGRRSDTRPRVLEVLRQATEPLSGAEVRQKLEAQGSSGPKGGSVHNMLTRLVEEGEVIKQDGTFSLASNNPPSSNGVESLNHDQQFIDKASGAGDSRGQEEQEFGL